MLKKANEQRADTAIVLLKDHDEKNTLARETLLAVAFYLPDRLPFRVDSAPVFSSVLLERAASNKRMFLKSLLINACLVAFILIFSTPEELADTILELIGLNILKEPTILALYYVIVVEIVQALAIQMSRTLGYRAEGVINNMILRKSYYILLVMLFIIPVLR